eukprot:PhF_6_TR3640/c0_g1_i1/m.5156
MSTKVKVPLTPERETVLKTHMNKRFEEYSRKRLQELQSSSQQEVRPGTGVTQNTKCEKHPSDLKPTSVVARLAKGGHCLSPEQWLLEARKTPNAKYRPITSENIVRERVK